MSFHPAERALRHLPVVTLLAALALGGSACSSNGGGNGGATDVDIQTVLDLFVTSGNDIAGLQVEISHAAGVTIVAATPVGPNAGGTCEANLGVNFASLACLARTEFDPPERVWSLTFNHTVSQRPRESILSLDCMASDSMGVVVPVDCDLR